MSLGIVGIVIVSNAFDDLNDDLNEIFNPDLDPSPVLPASAIAEYGSDPRLDGLADRCAGSGTDASDACSELFWADAPLGSGYEDYGGSCGARPDRDAFTCSRQD